MRTKIKGNGFFMSAKPSRVVIRQRLSNGQYMSLRFYRHRTTAIEDVLYCWKVSLYIGDKKAADRWNRGKGKDSGKQTGAGSIAGLRLAMLYVIDFATDFIGSNAELQIDFEDAKRGRVYERLLKHRGFTDYRKEGKLYCIAYRNPDRWEWNENEKGAGA